MNKKKKHKGILSPDEIKKLLKDPKYLKSVLKEGNLKENTISNSKLNNIYNKIGILNFD